MSDSRYFIGFYKLCVMAFALGFTALLIYTSYEELWQRPEDSLLYGKHTQPYDASPAELGAFINEVVKLLNDEATDANMLTPYQALLSYPLHLDIYDNQQPVGEVYSFGGTAKEVLASFRQTFDTSRNRKIPLISDNATIVISIFYNPQELDFLSAKVNHILSRSVTVGRSGLLLSCRDQALLMPPMRWITRGMRNARAGAFTYLSALGCSKDTDMGPGSGRVVVFESRDYIQRQRGEEVTDWIGVDQLVTQSEVTKARMEQFLRDSVSWLLEHMDEKGKLTYYYYPLFDQVSEENQLIRQWLATRAVGEIAEYFNDHKLRQHYMKNVRYNIDSYGKTEGNGLSFPLKDYAYLATNNVAAHALTTVPLAMSEYKSEYDAIIHAIEGQLRDNGMFDTIISLPSGVQKSSKKQDRHFASGSAMIAIGDALANGTLSIDPAVFKPTFEFYYDYWQREKRLYASGWQALGYYHMYQAYQDTDYLDAVFEVVDHMLSCQITEHERKELIGAYGKEGCRNASIRGSSSGVRLEGVVVAYKAAKELGDEARMARYRESARLAMRHILQNQMHEDDVFYLPNPNRAIGAIRDNYHLNSVRVDNVAHAVNGVYAALKHIDGVFD